MARARITSDNVTPLIQIITWFCLIISVLCFLARGATKSVLVHQFNLDDVLLILSVFFLVGQSASITAAAANGYGQYAAALTASQLEVSLKAQYAAGILYILSMGFAKLAVLVFMKSITPVTRDRKLADYLFIFIVGWTTSGAIVAAFSCQVPRPWDYIKGQCLSMYKFHNYFGIMGIIIDASLILLPLKFIWKMNAPRMTRAYVFMFFAFRIVVIGAALCKLVYLNRNAHAPDAFFQSWVVTLCAQVIQCLNLLSACVLYLRPFLRSLQSGFVRTDDLRRQGFGDHYGGQSQYGSDGSRWSVFKGASKPRFGDFNVALHSIGKNRHTTTVVSRDPDLELDCASQHSRADIIRQTRTFEVETSSPIVR